MDRKIIEDVQKLRKEGKSFGKIAVELLITKSQACYCSKINLDEYDEKKTAYQKYVNNVCELAKKCTNINQILKILGKKSTNEYYKQIKKILEENNIDISHFTYNEKFKPNGVQDKKTIDNYLIIGSSITISKLRDRLISEGIKEHKCERCGRTEWEGEKIPLQLHHINGDRMDNRLENLQLLCPNCHTLTDNYCGKKLRKESNVCKKCGKKIYRKSTYCRECYNELKKNEIGKYKNHNGDIVNSQRPTKEILINDFKEFGSFTSVGKKYGVSDKTVRNWCEKYNLPSFSLEMRKYIRKIFGEDLKWKFNNGNADSLKKYYSQMFKKIALLNEKNEIEKIYYSYEEIKNDGYEISHVKEVCNGIRFSHHHRKFKFLE